MADVPTTKTPSTSLLKKATLTSMLTSPRGLWRFLRDPSAPKSAKILSVLTLGYVVVPFDMLPDWILPVLGWCDDIGITAAALAFVASQAAKYANEHPEITARPVETATSTNPEE